jgi:hypothetical protein
MPNKYTKKYLGKLPVIACAIKSEEEQQRLASHCDNFVFDSFTPKK